MWWKKKQNNKVTLLAYREGIWELLIYQFVTKLLLAVCVWGMKQLAGLLLWRAGRPAITSGDIPYLFRSWEGWTLAAIGIVVLILYISFEIHIMILMSDNILNQRKKKFLGMAWEALSKLRYYLHPMGVLVILYVSFLGPLVGSKLGISLTSTFKIPDFILSFILSKTWLKLLYYGLLAVLFCGGILYIFTFHFMVLGNRRVTLAMKESRRFVLKEKGKLLKAAGKLIVSGTLWLGAGFVIVFLILLEVAGSEQMELFWRRFVMIESVAGLGAVLALAGILFPIVFFLTMTMLYQEHVSPEIAFQVPEKKKKRKWILIPIVVGAAGITAMSVLSAVFFDEFFPKSSTVELIGHRGAGTYSSENTVESIEAAAQLKLFATEIDVQRTKDGQYILNHDNDFMRLCQDDRTPQEMTLEEIKELRIRNTGKGKNKEPQEVATLEEVLDAAKGKIRLYIELKGKTADKRMAEEVYQLVKEKEMLSQCTFICLNYPLINYLESRHPDADTGYLCFYSFGDLEEMNCDRLLLEMETATESNVEKIHEAGKKVDVWTINSGEKLQQYLLRSVDGIITDEVKEGVNTRKFLNEREDLGRVLGMLAEWF